MKAQTLRLVYYTKNYKGQKGTFAFNLLNKL